MIIRDPRSEVRLLYIALIVLRYWDSKKDHTEMIDLSEVADSKEMSLFCKLLLAQCTRKFFE